MNVRDHRILTTHVGSMPRSRELFDLLLAEDRGEPIDRTRLNSVVSEAVFSTVREQADAGIDIVGDGEMGKSSYTHYVKHRLSGVTSGEWNAGTSPHMPQDMAEHPDVAAATARGTARNLLAPLVCQGPVSYADIAPVERDIADLKAALGSTTAKGAFITSAAPGTLVHFVRNGHYKSEDAFLADLADAMRTEYEAIWKAGFTLQIDCPDLAMTRHMTYKDRSDGEFLKLAARNVEALNHATRNIPPEAMRMHICWGNYPGPHTHDVAISKIASTVLRARPQAVLFEGANPRHEHEWEEWRDAKIPQDKILVPGVIDTTTNHVEHPRLVAQRLERYISIVGSDRVMAGTDCGFGTVAGRDVVAPSVVVAKLKCLAEGAQMASV